MHFCFLATCSLLFCKHRSNFLRVLFSKPVIHICENFLTQVQVVPMSSLQPFIYCSYSSSFIYSFVGFLGFPTHLYQENCAVYQRFLVLLFRVFIMFVVISTHAQITWLHSVGMYLTFSATCLGAKVKCWTPESCDIQYFRNFIKKRGFFFYNSHVHLEETLKHINAFNIVRTLTFWCTVRQLHTIA
jgi:hypothetical protein